MTDVVKQARTSCFLTWVSADVFKRLSYSYANSTVFVEWHRVNRSSWLFAYGLFSFSFCVLL